MIHYRFFRLLSFAVLMPALCFAQISLKEGVPYSQSFNLLADSGKSSVLPLGWHILESGKSADCTYNAGTGSSTTGDTYSFGSKNDTDRALGCLQSGSLIPSFGAQFINETGVKISRLLISYSAEQWRLGTAGRSDSLLFQLSTDASGLSTGSWIGIKSLGFATPYRDSLGLRNGNIFPNRFPVKDTIYGLSIENGSSFWIRWTDWNAPGADDGLAIDDFSIEAAASGNSVSEIYMDKSYYDAELFQNYPNPFNPETRIPLRIIRCCHVKIDLCDILGRTMAHILDAYMRPGNYAFSFNSRNLPGGIYICKVQAGNYNFAQKLCLLK